MSEVQTLNYSSHAIEDIGRVAAKMPGTFAATSSRMRRVAQLLDRSVKFLLPERGELIDMQRIDEATMDMMRLPFPLLALEVPFPPTGSIVESGPMKETVSTRRIVLAWDESFAAQSSLAPDYREPGIYVLAVYYSDELREWVVSPVGLFMPRATEIRAVGDGARNASEGLAIQTLMAQQAITSKSPVLDVRYFEALPQMMALLVEQVGHDVANARMQLDVRDELLFTWSFCLTVNCVNISLATVAPSEKLNSKRIRNGKPPLYSYRVLELPEPKGAGAGAPGYKLEGVRLAPRTHLRRGHPRRLQDGRMTYVRAALIGAGNAGVVQKDYRVPGRGATG